MKNIQALISAKIAILNQIKQQSLKERKAAGFLEEIDDAIDEKRASTISYPLKQYILACNSLDSELDFDPQSLERALRTDGFSSNDIANILQAFKTRYEKAKPNCTSNPVLTPGAKVKPGIKEGPQRAWTGEYNV